MGIWRKLSSEEINQRVSAALQGNVDFKKGKFLGVPASHLDSRVFYDDAPFLKEAPYMRTMKANPNHIGCHTMGESEAFFAGTHEIERELIRICAEDILKGEANQQDGYVASGGTEANIQAMWIYRNLFKQKYGFKYDEMGILCSSDTHYAVYKAGNLLNLQVFVVPTTPNTRKIEAAALQDKINLMKHAGVKAVMVMANMGTTMFGSVDDPDLYAETLNDAGMVFKIHADGAYGGFIYPFTANQSKLNFANPNISSVTLDAHKLAQAPYGTGIFLARKGLMQYVMTREAEYVHGHDVTLVGSRSGANAVAVWMILSNYGPHQWREKVWVLMQRTSETCARLKNLDIPFYRNADMNIITMPAEHIPDNIAHEFNLVPDNHDTPAWYKIVVMDHVTPDLLVEFTEGLK
jgi:tyrosine decarboxylase / aspartate 1-decarboxylase